MRVSKNEKRLLKFLRKGSPPPVDLIAECLAEGLDVQRIMQSFEASQGERL